MEKIINLYYKIRYFIKNLPYRIKCRFYYKSYIIKTSLNKWARHDTVEILLYGMMDAFKEFYEIEVVDGVVCYECDEQHRNVKRDMDEIYKWWCNYENRLKDIENALHEWYTNSQKWITKPCETNPKYKTIVFPERTPKETELWEKLNKMEEDLEKETEEMLLKLVKIRNFLWT
jgi:hypothetical protein